MTTTTRERRKGANGASGDRETATLAKLGGLLGTRDYTAALEVMRELAEVSGAAAAAPWTRHEASEIFIEPEPILYVSRDLELAPGPPSLLAGYGYSGKTVCAQNLAIAVCIRGLAWDRFPCRKGRVLHIDYEQGSRLTLERYRRLARAAGATEQELVGQLSVVCSPRTYLDSPGAEDTFAREVEGYDLVIIDSLKAGAPSTEENGSDVRVPLDMLMRVSERTGVTFLVIHHARKPQRDAPGGIRMSIRGSGALYDACQSVLVLDGGPGVAPKCHHVKARITGKEGAPVVLSIQDVACPNGKDRRWGLRVVATTATEVEAAAEERATSELDAALVAAATKSPGMSGRELIGSVKGSDNTKRTALDRLVREHKLTEVVGTGRGGGMRYYPPGGTP